MCMLQLNLCIPRCICIHTERQRERERESSLVCYRWFVFDGRTCAVFVNPLREHVYSRTFNHPSLDSLSETLL